MIDSFSEPDEIEDYTNELESEFDKGRKQGALEELKRIEEAWHHIGSKRVCNYIQKRIKELEGGSKMNVIKFSNNYPKLWGQKNAKLVFIEHIFDEDFPLNKDVIEYDTKNCDGKYYPLPRGDYLQLIFLGDKNIPFCTIRRFTPQKYEYYKSKFCEVFDIKIE